MNFNSLCIINDIPNWLTNYIIYYKGKYVWKKDLMDLIYNG